jgi:anthranilate phosphoribosyltransferase
VSESTTVRTAPGPTPSRHHNYSGFRATLKLIGTGPRGSRDLSFEEARDAMRAVLAGEVSPAQAGAFLIAARIKGESPAELAGYAQALRDASVPLAAHTARPVVCCAGAYDGSAEAPQLSLAAAVLAAACGAGVVVHCGPHVGPKRGVTPADVLGALGGIASPAPGDSESMLERAGVALVDTGRTVAGWSELLGVRDEIGLRGPVHSAEKLLDFFGARAFVVGYTHGAYCGRLLGALGLLRAQAAVAVRGVEGSDVVRPGRPVAHGLEGPLELPERLGASALASDSDAGAAASAALTRAVLGGEERGSARVAVVLSAAIRLYAAGLVRDPRDGIDPADRAIAAGRASATLETLVGR